MVGLKIWCGFQHVEVKYKGCLVSKLKVLRQLVSKLTERFPSGNHDRYLMSRRLTLRKHFCLCVGAHTTFVGLRSMHSYLSTYESLLLKTFLTHIVQGWYAIDFGTTRPPGVCLFGNTDPVSTFGSKSNRDTQNPTEQSSALDFARHTQMICYQSPEQYHCLLDSDPSRYFCGSTYGVSGSDSRNRVAAILSSISGVGNIQL